MRVDQEADPGHRFLYLGLGVIFLVLIGLALFISIPNSAYAADDSARLVGSWKLVSWTTRNANGSTEFPMGESPAGLLMYDAKGNMSLQIMDDFRPVFSQGYEKTSFDELKEVYKTYAAMFGRYTVNPDTRSISIEVQGITNPNYMSSTLIRYYKFEDDLLVLAFDPKGMNSTVWKRLK